MHLNKRIAKIREANKLTQAEFGERIKVSQNYVWMLESGRRTPADRTIDDICRVFNVNEQWLRTGEGDMTAPASREQELSRYVGQLLADRPESIRSALITTLMRFDPAGPEWAVLERIVRETAAEMEKPPGD